MRPGYDTWPLIAAPRAYDMAEVETRRSLNHGVVLVSTMHHAAAPA